MRRRSNHGLSVHHIGRVQELFFASAPSAAAVCGSVTGSDEGTHGGHDLTTTYTCVKFLTKAPCKHNDAACPQKYIILDSTRTADEFEVYNI